MTTTLHSSDQTSVDFEAAIENARRIYEEKLLPRYITSHKGRYIIVDGVSGHYEVAENPEDVNVLERLYARKPNAITFGTCVGNPIFPTLPAHPTWEEVRDEWPWNQIPSDKPASEWPTTVKLIQE